MKCFYLEVCVLLAQIRADWAIRMSKRSYEKAKFAVDGYARACNKLLEWKNRRVM